MQPKISQNGLSLFQTERGYKYFAENLQKNLSKTATQK